jgi:hypothetical protein
LSLTLLLGLAGCLDDEGGRYRGDRDRYPERYESRDNDRHEERHDTDRHEERGGDSGHERGEHGDR